MSALRVWTRTEIADTATALAREVLHHNPASGGCPCGQCGKVRSAREGIRQAAEPAAVTGARR